MDEDPRRSQMSGAAQWYTHPSIGFTLIRINYPTSISDVLGMIRGVCSCGKTYQYVDGLIDPKTSGCRSPAKHPHRRDGASRLVTAGGDIGPHGDGLAWYEDPTLHASTPEEAIEMWADKPWNIGVLVGEPFSTFVIDVDMKASNREGWRTWMKIIDALPEDKRAVFSETMTERTSGHDDDSRGWHLFYKVESPEAWDALRKLPKSVKFVDFLVEKRQAVVAPSVHASGESYQREKRTMAPVELGVEEVAALVKAVETVRGHVGDTGVGTSGQFAGSASGLNRGDFMDQVKYLLAMNEPQMTYGPGEHHDSLKGLFGAAVAMGDMITPDVARYYQMRMESEPGWIPEWYMHLCVLIDEAVTKPEPWLKTDPENTLGLIRYAVRSEMRKVLSAEDWARTVKYETKTGGADS